MTYTLYYVAIILLLSFIDLIKRHAKDNDKKSGEVSLVPYKTIYIIDIELDTNRWHYY